MNKMLTMSLLRQFSYQIPSKITWNTLRGKDSQEPYKESLFISSRNSESRRRRESVHKDPYDLSKNKGANKVCGNRRGGSTCDSSQVIGCLRPTIRKALYAGSGQLFIVSRNSSVRLPRLALDTLLKKKGIQSILSSA